MGTAQRSNRLALAGLIAGALALTGASPAIATEGSEIFVYTGEIGE